MFDLRLNSTMECSAVHTCAVCGEQKITGQVWFLLADNYWEDKVRILQWEDRLAALDNVYCACSSAHARELIAHWMTIGTLDYPFADSGLRIVGVRRQLASLRVFDEPVAQGARQLGELTVHRESIDRILEENSAALKIILDELVDELERETGGALARFESVRFSMGWSRAV